MKGKFIKYALVVSLISSLLSWGKMFAGSNEGGGSAWSSGSGGSRSGGGHK